MVEVRPGWVIELGGLLFDIEDRTMVLGRDPACDIPISDERVSWRHLQIELADGSPRVTDLGSSNGTFLDGARIDTAPRRITREAIIQIGSVRGRLREKETETSPTTGRFRRVPVRTKRVRIGRAPDNDVVLDVPNVSWHHAEVRPGHPPTLVDLGSRNGVRLGNQLLQGATGPLQPGLPAGVGPFSLRYEGGELIVSDERGGLSLTAHQVSVRVGQRTILYPTSLSVAPGEFVALIGPSGSGKTTLLKCLAGVGQPTSGRVMVAADPLELRLTEVGYVPQSDVVHDRLSVHEALLYAARLRLPSDTRRSEHLAAVQDVLEELRLVEHQQTMVGRLSGGQRKRVACGVELIGKPTMLLLDEPTSGLDPALERRLMLTFRRLADSGRGIVVVTHATSSLSLCDTVAVMGQGGHVLFLGSPRDSLEHFQVPAYDEIYNAIDLADVPPTTDVPIPAVPRGRSKLLSGRSLLGHTRALTGRYARTLLRDRRTIAILLGQAPVMAALIGLLYPRHLLRLPDHQPSHSAVFVFLLVTAALWLGLIDSCREIVKERSIILRELVVGVRLDAYLLSKATLLFLLAAIQCILLLAVAVVIQPLYSSASSYLGLAGMLILASWSAVALGLMVSTVAKSVDQATSLIPLLLIPQLLFGGALVPFARMAPAIKGLADLMVSRWAFAGAGHAISMNVRLADAPQVAALTGFRQDFFSLNESVAAIILLGFTAALLLASAVLLANRANRPA